MSFIIDPAEATACITFASHEVRRTYDHLHRAVQGWVWHRLQETTLAVGTIGPIPVDPETVCYVSYRVMLPSHDELSEFWDAYEDEYPNVNRILVVTSIRFVSVDLETIPD